MSREVAMQAESTVEDIASKRRFRPYPEYRNSGIEAIGPVPEVWQILQLKHTLLRKPGAIKTGPFGSQLLSSEMTGGSVKVYNQRTVLDRDFDAGDNFITEEKYEQLAAFAVSSCDVLVTTRGTIGRCAIVPTDAERGILHPCVMRVQPDERTILREYLWLLIQDSRLVTTQLVILSNATTIDVVYSDSLKQVRLPVPPVSEQRAIAAFLDRETARIDELVAKKQRLIELLDEKRTTLISHAVTNGLNPDAPMKESGIEWLGRVPQGWHTRRLKFLSHFVTSGSRGWAQFYCDDGAVFLRIGNLSRKSIDLRLDDIQRVMPPDSAEGKRTLAIHNDLLLSVTAYIGAVAIVPPGLGEAHVNQHTALVRLRAEHVVPRWVAYCLFSVVGQRQLRSLTYGGTKDGLGLDDVKDLSVLIPPIDEQQIIVEYLDERCSRSMGLVQRILDAIHGLREYRSALISAAVTGKIDVRCEVN